MISNFATKMFYKNLRQIILLTIILLACTTNDLETPQSPIAQPIKTKSSPIPNTPKVDDSPTNNFSLQNINNIAPPDVLEEIEFAGTGGGKGCGGAFNHPTIFDTRDTFEWMAVIDVFACGWKSDELVQVTLTLPNGKSITAKIQAQQSGESYRVWYIYKPKLGDPTGIYSFTLSGDNGTVEHKINISMPNEPRLYYIYDIQSLILYNFYPNERVRLFLYVPNTFNTLSLKGWQEYKTDSSGQLLVKAFLSLGWYGVIGDKSGMVDRSGNIDADPVVHINFSNQTQASTESSDIQCSGALPSRLEVGKYAYVATDPPLDQRVREGAGTDYPIIGYIDTGNAMKILDGPKCADGWAWWKVQSIKKSDLVGWTSEGDDVYWLIPCDSLNACP